MGTNCAPLVEGLFLFCYDSDIMMSLSDDKQADIIEATFASILKRKRKQVGCFAIIVLQMYGYCKCSVALPSGDVAWSAVCDCDIS